MEEFINRMINDKLYGLKPMFLHTLILSPEQLVNMLNGNIGVERYGCLPYQETTLSFADENKIAIICDYGSFKIEICFSVTARNNKVQCYKIEDISGRVIE